MHCGDLLCLAYICKIWWCGDMVLGFVLAQLVHYFLTLWLISRSPLILYVLGISSDKLVAHLCVICCYYVIFPFGELQLPNLLVLGWVALKAIPTPTMWQFSMIQSKLNKGYQDISFPKRSFHVQASECIIYYYSLNLAVAKRIWNP